MNENTLLQDKLFFWYNLIGVNMKYLIYYLIIINIICFVMYGIDKSLAKLRKSRVSERWLFFLGFLGGALGAVAGMLVFRHKTKKLKFYLWNILMFILWGYLIYRFYF